MSTISEALVSPSRTLTAHVPVTESGVVLGSRYHRPWLAETLAEALAATISPWRGQPVFLAPGAAQEWVAEVMAWYPMFGSWTVEPCEVLVQRFTDDSTRLLFRSSTRVGVRW